MLNGSLFFGQRSKSEEKRSNNAPSAKSEGRMDANTILLVWDTLVQEYIKKGEVHSFAHNM